MSVRYKEQFLINRRTYHIGDDFSVWSGGCKIHGDAKSMDEARKILHGYARNQLSAEIGSNQTALEKAVFARDRLGNDPFHLGRFIQ